MSAQYVRLGLYVQMCKCEDIFIEHTIGGGIFLLLHTYIVPMYTSSWLQRRWRCDVDKVKAGDQRIVRIGFMNPIHVDSHNTSHRILRTHSFLKMEVFDGKINQLFSPSITYLVTTLMMRNISRRKILMSSYILSAKIPIMAKEFPIQIKR